MGISNENQNINYFMSKDKDLTSAFVHPCNPNLEIKEKSGFSLAIDKIFG